MGYVFTFQDAATYDRLLQTADRRTYSQFESQLMLEMLRPEPGDALLEVGCGTGASLLQLLEQRLQLTGIDASPYMLDFARRHLGQRCELYRAQAEDLPFDDNAFNHTIFMTSLEFVDDPRQALAEACRVTKDRLFIGILNRFAIMGLQRRIKGIFQHSIYNRARFFSIWEVKAMVRALVGDVPMQWRTICQLPITPAGITGKIERSGLVQRCPFGAFIGMVVTLQPTYKTRPLKLKYKLKNHTGLIPG
mgnify:CR=1 FL=1